MKKKYVYGFGVAALVAVVVFANAQNSETLLTPAGVNALMQKDTNVVVLDVRTPAEFNSETGHLSKAILIPVQELEKRIGELSRYKKQTVIVYCRTGHRSTAGAEILLKNGYAAVNMAGGITRWKAEQLPVAFEPHH